MNNFGGKWTKEKIEILVEYAQAYLAIMNFYAHQYKWKLLYFDGFAGSGSIAKELKENEEETLSFDQVQQVLVGAAVRILEITDPRSFDMYYFVEKDTNHFKTLKENTKKKYTQKIYVSNDDCNKKLEDLAQFLLKNRKYKSLLYLDPYGTQIAWESLVGLKGLSVDMWILVPTGLAINRSLKNDGNNLVDAHVKGLIRFLGITEEEIKEHFYDKRITQNLFGKLEEQSVKKGRIIERILLLYTNRLNTIFKHVSRPYVLKTEKNNVLYHFMLASNNEIAVKIANEIVDKFNGVKQIKKKKK
jgi:three-Cys-motif partner protein